MNTKRLTKLVAVVLVLVMALTTLVACPKPPVVTPAEFKQAEYNTTTVVMPIKLQSSVCKILLQAFASAFAEYVT